MKSILSITVNGRPREDAVADSMLLLDYLRHVRQDGFFEDGKGLVDDMTLD